MTLHLVDLTDVVSIVGGSIAGVLAFFQVLRTLFLDRLTKGRLDADQQDALYHVLVWLIIAGLIVVQALLKNYQFNLTLVVSALVSAWPIQRTVNLLYNKLQQVQPVEVSGTLASVAPSAPFTPDPNAPILVQPESTSANSSAS